MLIAIQFTDAFFLDQFCLIRFALNASPNLHRDCLICAAVIHSPDDQKHIRVSTTLMEESLMFLLPFFLIGFNNEVMYCTSERAAGFVYFG